MNMEGRYFYPKLKKPSAPPLEMEKHKKVTKDKYYKELSKRYKYEIDKLKNDMKKINFELIQEMEKNAILESELIKEKSKNAPKNYYIPKKKLRI